MGPGVTVEPTAFLGAVVIVSVPRRMRAPEFVMLDTLTARPANSSVLLAPTVMVETVIESCSV